MGKSEGKSLDEFWIRYLDVTEGKRFCVDLYSIIPQHDR